MQYEITIDPAVMRFTIEAETFEEAEQEALDAVLQHWEITEDDNKKQTTRKDWIMSARQQETITMGDIVYWVGNGFDPDISVHDELCQIIAEIANGKYTIEQLRKDIDREDNQ